MEKLIKESLHNLLLENYATIQELQKMGNEILFFIGEIWEEKGVIDLGLEVNTRNFINPTKFDKLTEFIKGFHLTIKFQNATEYDNDLGAFYSKQKIIKLTVSDRQVDGLNRGLKSGYGLRVDMYEYFHSTLLHELQHAYDSWRSGGKYLNFKEKERVNDKEYKAIWSRMKDWKDRTDDDKKKIEVAYNSYLKQTHEVNARFTQTIKDLRVWELHLDGNRRREIKEWSVFFEEFKTKFVGWDVIGDRTKKQLTRRLSKVYLDGIDDFNKQNQS